MKFGETSDSIHAYSFPVQEGYSTPGWPYDLAVQVLEAIDGSVIDTVDFGAREHRTAEFNLNYLPRADYDALKTWMDANLGQVVRVEMENAGERVFGEQFPGPVVYAYLRPYRSLGEQAFTVGHQYNGFAMQMDLAGAASSSVPNAADTSKYDFCVKVDCARITAGCQVANFAALSAITNKPGGSRGLTTSDLKIYFYNAANSTWEYQYTLPPNDPAQGLKYGVFRWSAFADISASATGIGGEAYKSGWLIKNAIRFPRYSIDLRRGPAVERPEGYSFAAQNSGRLWKSPLDRNLAWYGAYCEAAVYDRLNGVLVPMRAGYNNLNSFDYEQLQFDVEPGLFMQDRTFPPTVIGKDNYPDAADAVRGQPVQATYGRFDLGALQPVNFTLVAARFPNGRRYLALSSYNAGAPSVTLQIDPAQFTAALGYGYGSYPAAPTKTLYVQIIAQDDQPELNKLIKVTAIADGGSGTTVLTLKTKWQVPPDGATQFRVMLANILLILDDDPCIGYRTPGYLKDTAEAGQFIPMELWAKTDKLETVSPLPAKLFKPVGSGENQLALDTDSLSMDSFGTILTEQEYPLSIEYPSWLHNIMDAFQSGYSTFNFGFSPDGVPSNEVTVRPYDKITNWLGVPATPGGGNQYGHPAVPPDGHLQALYSNDRTTLIWTPYPGASGYTLYRYKVSQAVKQAPPSASRARAAAPIEFTFQLDTAFGSGGSYTVSGEQSTVYVDTTVSNTEPLQYEYRLTPTFTGGGFAGTLVSNRGQNRAVRNGNPGIVALGKDGGLTVAWALPPSQASFTVEIDGSPISGMPFVSATQTYYVVPGLTNNTKYKVRVKITGISVGSPGDTWYVPTADFTTPVHQLKTGTNNGLSAAFDVKLDQTRSNMNSPLMFPDQTPSGTVPTGPNTESRFQLCYVVRNLKGPTAGAGFPAAAVVFSWALYMNHDQIGDLSDAKDVRLLADFVARMHVDLKTPVKLTIQLRGLRADKSVTFVQPEYKGLTGKAPTESDGKGGFFQFYNLPEAHGGAALDVNYNTEDYTANANGLYRGKDLWKLPDMLFENGAQLWRETKYLVFSITNSEPIAWDYVQPKDRGFQFGIGGPPGATWNMVKGHKSVYFLEVTREFKGGLEEPEYIRIDGGKKDVSGSITGTAGAPIEVMRHIADDVVQSMLGYKPAYIGTEMQSRLTWLGRLQTRKAMKSLETLEFLAKNLWGFFTLSADDKLYFRSLDIEDPNVPSVFTFNDSNILKDGLGKPEMRRRNEIFQKFRLQYNVEPSVGGKATEEMLIGWDLAASKAIEAGYAQVRETLDGALQNQDTAENLWRLCRLSIQINTAGLGANEYGVAADDEKIFEMHYRPTSPSLATGEKVERDLPNRGGAKPPKVAMQELARMLVQFYTMDSWYFSLKCSMKNLIYNSAITGKLPDGSTDHRLKLGDVVTVNSYFHTGGQDVRAFVVDIDASQIYQGVVELHLFAPRPPGQFGSLIAPIWDAGAPGARNEANYLFKGSLYGLLSEDGTFADAGAPGTRDTNNFKFPDGTFADPKGTGTGKA